MYDELVHVGCFVSKACHAIATWFEGAKVMLEECVVSRADDGEVVGHGGQAKLKSDYTNRTCPTQKDSLTPEAINNLLRLDAYGIFIEVIQRGRHRRGYVLAETPAASLIGVASHMDVEGLHRDDITSLRTAKMFGAFKPSAPLSGGLLWYHIIYEFILARTR